MPVCFFYCGGGTDKQHLLSLLKKYKIITPTPTPFKNEVPSAKPTIDLLSPWLVHKTATGSAERIVNLNEVIYPGRNYMLHWNGYLLYAAKKEDDGTVAYYSLNLETGATRQFFLFDPKANNARSTTDRSEFRIIDGVLYISFGGYLTPTETYAVRLPVTTDATLVTNQGAWIRDINGYWFITGGFGDACTGVTKYSLLDTASGDSSFITKLSFACGDGETLLGIDRTGRMIIGGYRNAPGKTMVYDAAYVYALPLDRPTVKEGVIAEADMPKGIKNMKYDRDSDSILLIGPQLYVRDIQSGTLRDAGKLNAGYENISNYARWDGNTVCIMDTGGSVVTAVIDTISGKQLSSNTCIIPTPTPTPFVVPAGDPRVFIKSLDLPATYDVVYE